MLIRLLPILGAFGLQMNMCPKKRQRVRPSEFGSVSTIGHQVSFVESGSHEQVRKRPSNVVATGISNENITFKKQCMRLADLSSVSHIDLQEPSEHQNTKSLPVEISVTQATLHLLILLRQTFLGTT